MGFSRIMALLLSALMMLAPMSAFAEDLGFSAGDLTATTLSESFYGGYQINVSFGFDVDDDELSGQSEAMKAGAALLEEMQANLSFYDDFGTARVRGALTLDGVDLLTGDMLVFEDGAVQLTTNLTGNLVFAFPAGTITEEGVNMPSVRIVQYEWMADDVPAYERLKYSGSNMITTVINLLLGWVSGVHMETGELYTFDYENYIEATDVRDAVATRMIGKIRSTDFIKFIWNLITHIRDREQEFLEDLSYSLGNFGLTRYQGRQLIDALFTNREIDYELLEVDRSEDVLDDGTTFQPQDMRYALSVLETCVLNAWNQATDTTSSMIVSYDDFGEMVGFDAELARVTDYYPYEGTFTYSIKTDDNWQRLHTSHGEMQLFNDQRLIGDLNMQFGEDVDGVKASYVNGQLALLDQKSGEALGFSVASALAYESVAQEDAELIEGAVELMLLAAGEAIPALNMNLSAKSVLTDDGLALDGVLSILAGALPQIDVIIGVECVEYDEAPYEGGQAVEISGAIDMALIDEIESEIKNNAAGVAMKFTLKPSVMSNALKLLGAFAE